MPSESTNGWRPTRELADLLGGYDGGWSFWSAALSAIELTIARSRERVDGFTFAPETELKRVLRDLEDALGLAVTAVTVQQLVNDGESDGRARSRRADVAAMLLERSREARRARIGLSD